MTQTPTDLAWPEHGVTRVPYRVYDDPQIYEREQARLFRGPAWHYLGLDCEIPKPGDYKLNYVGDTPVILTRDEHGEVHAMVNRCAHRGAFRDHGPHGQARLQCANRIASGERLS